MCKKDGGRMIKITIPQIHSGEETDPLFPTGEECQSRLKETYETLQFRVLSGPSLYYSDKNTTIKTCF